jgi:hypothetical protein
MRLPRGSKPFIYLFMIFLITLFLRKIYTPNIIKTATIIRNNNDNNLIKSTTEVILTTLQLPTSVYEQEIIRYMKTFIASPPPNFEKWVRMAKNLNCSMNFSDYAQIRLDLKPFMEWGISRETVKKATTLRHAAIYHIENGSFIAEREGNYVCDGKLLKSIKHLLPESKRVTFVMNCLDEPRVLPSDANTPSEIEYYSNVQESIRASKCIRENENASIPYHGFFQMPFAFSVANSILPVFSACKLRSNCYKDIILPFTNPERFQEPINPPETDTKPWRTKKEKLTWRGSTTGGFVRSPDLLKKHHRYNFAAWALNRTKNGTENDLIDVGFTEFNFCGFENCESLVRKEYPFKKRLEKDEQYESKYLPVLDGHSWSSRFEVFLARSGSLLFYNGIFSEWFTNRLKPWVHYVPFKLDVSDLDERLKWARQNDAEAEIIATNAFRFAQNNLRYQDMKCYVGLLALEYAKLLK